MGLKFSPNNTSGGNLRFTQNQPGLMSSAYTVDWDFVTNIPAAVAALSSPGDLTRVNDTNVTLTLGGTPTDALLFDVSLTLGWSGTLAVARGGTAASSASGTALDNITGFSSTGQLVRTGAGTYAFRTLTAPAAGISLSNGDGVSGNPTLALANDLAALEGLGSTGIAVRTAADTWAQRTVTGTAAEITVTNGDGVSGNPTLSLPASLTFTGKTVSGGSFAGPNITVGDTALAIVDNSDNSKILRFECSGITTATARTLTVPDADTTIVGTDTTQTLTNKDISSGTNTYRAATTALLGASELATDTEARALASVSVVLTPSNLAAVLATDVQTFTSSGTWTKPAQGRVACIQGIGAGGGGARRSAGNGSGGGCGPYYELWMLLSDLGATETVTIGAGGAVQSTDSTNGNAGGTTSFGTHLTIYGGRGGEQVAAGVAVSGGGSGAHHDTWADGSANSVGLLTGFGVNAGIGVTLSQALYGASATGATAANAVQTIPIVAFKGGAGGAGHSTTGPVSGVQNTSLSGGDGGAGNGAGAGGNGANPGGGGGSGTTQGGSGGNGQIIVTVF